MGVLPLTLKSAISMLWKNAKTSQLEKQGKPKKVTVKSLDLVLCPCQFSDRLVDLGLLGALHTRKTIVKQKPSYYPKTNLAKPGAQHPFGPKTLMGSYKWADKFFTALASQYGAGTVAKRLQSWSWDASTCFSGVGCAEMALNLQNLKRKSRSEKVQPRSNPIVTSALGANMSLEPW